MYILAFVIGLLFLVWGSFRMKNDFKSDKPKNNLFQLLLSGQASGIGQVLSGVVMIVIGFLILFLG